MPSVNILRESSVERTPRVMQMEGLFDVPPSQRSREAWSVNFNLPEEWNVGLIVGPSGSGKTTIAQELFGANIVCGWEWPNNRSVLDGFPSDMSIKEIVALLSSVGFSSPPSWIRPFRVLSNGEQFRVNLARTLAEMPNLSVIDEFTSVVDRTVAQIGSAAIQKTVRRRNQKFIAVSCHYDIIDWLEPDWVYQPHTGEYYVGRYLHQRPQIELEVKRVHHSAWKLFGKHHYLNSNLNTAAHCFVAFWKDTPVAFTSWLHFLHATKNAKREHRTVCLPDYQGVGIGNAVSDYLASVICGMGYDAISTTGNPAMIQSRNRSDKWKITRKANITSPGGKGRNNINFRRARASNRITCAFEYVGASLETGEAIRIWTG